MAAVSVFVDDAIRGRLPMVCVRTGEPADLMVRSQRPVGGGMGGLWLLALLGPLGWVALVLVACLGPRQEVLTVRLPWTRAAFDAERQVRRMRNATLGMGAVTLLAGLVSPMTFPLLLPALGVGLLVVGLVLAALAVSRALGITLDGSRRWVTLTRVSPAFARAVEAQELLSLRG